MCWCSSLYAALQIYEGPERRRAVRALKDPGTKNNVTLKANVTNSRCYWAWNELQAPFPFFFSTFERIAKKILLAQIKANLSSSDDMSWDEETQADESESDGDREVREGDEKNATVGDGKSVST